MRDSPGMRHRAATPLLLLFPIALASLAGCGPDAEGGYPKEFRHTQRHIAEVAKPSPPRVTAPLASAGGAGAQVIAASLPSGVTQEMVDEGQQLYGTVCVACHGAGGAGSPAAPALNDAQWLNISGNYEEIITLIHSGVANPKQYPAAMPALGGGNFNDEQVRAISAYVYALSHQEGT